MKKVLIFYASYGGGHLSAANSIKDYIDHNFQNAQTKLVDCVKFINKALDKVTTTAYKEMAKKAPWAWGQVYSHSQQGALSKISTLSNKIMSHQLFKLFEEYEPDLVISTHPFGSQMTSYLKKKNKINCKLATVMTDFAPHDQWLVGKEFVNYYFVAHNGMKDDLIKSGVSSECIFATGIPLSNKFLMHYDKTSIMNDFNLDDTRKVILFFGGR